MKARGYKAGSGWGTKMSRYIDRIKDEFARQLGWGDFDAMAKDDSGAYSMAANGDILWFSGASVAHALLAAVAAS